MYAFYADESGFSKSLKYEENQPILVCAGVLINFSRLRKALEVFDEILIHVNSLLDYPVNELKFSEIRNKHPYRLALPLQKDRADLIEKIVFDFQKNIKFKIIYCAIDNQKFYNNKKGLPVLKRELKHPYLCACYKMLSRLQKNQSPQKNNKGKTFVVLDEQGLYQNCIEELIKRPVHKENFSEIFDTAYFGESQYSKLIQIADLIAGIFKYYLLRLKQGCTPKSDYWVLRLKKIIGTLKSEIIQKECFENELKNIYSNFEISI